LKKLKAYIVKTNTIISPFGEDVAESLVGWQNLAENRKEIFLRLGMEAEYIDPGQTISDSRYLLIFDYVYVSQKLLKDFLNSSKKGDKSQSLAVIKNAAVEYLLPLQELAEYTAPGQKKPAIIYDIFMVSGALPKADNYLDLRKHLHQICQPQLVATREITVEVRLPTLPGQPAFMLFPITSSLACHITNWVHILWLNHLMFGVRWLERIYKHKGWTSYKLLEALAIQRSIKPWKLLQKMVVIGKGCHIHPTAYLEAAMIGDNVTIGAQACIRNSFVGPGSNLADHTVLLNSTLGADCCTMEDTFLVQCVSYPRAIIGNWKLQVSLIGRGAYINPWAGFIDAIFQGHVKVKHNGEIVSSRRAFLGSCIGHEAQVGGKVLIQPGREIPNHYRIVMRPDEVISCIPTNLPPGEPLHRQNGTLVLHKKD